VWWGADNRSWLQDEVLACLGQKVSLSQHGKEVFWNMASRLDKGYSRQEIEDIEIDASSWYSDKGVHMRLGMGKYVPGGAQADSGKGYWYVTAAAALGLLEGDCVAGLPAHLRKTEHLPAHSEHLIVAEENYMKNFPWEKVGDARGEKSKVLEVLRTHAETYGLSEPLTWGKLRLAKWTGQIQTGLRKPSAHYKMVSSSIRDDEYFAMAVWRDGTTGKRRMEHWESKALCDDTKVYDGVTGSSHNKLTTNKLYFNLEGPQALLGSHSDAVWTKLWEVILSPQATDKFAFMHGGEVRDAHVHVKGRRGDDRTYGMEVLLQNLKGGGR
jgi:hypothetical protein